MAARYHISPDGTPRKCNPAKTGVCRYGADTPHFTSVEDAKLEYELQMNERLIASLNARNSFIRQSRNNQKAEQEEYTYEKIIYQAPIVVVGDLEFHNISDNSEPFKGKLSWQAKISETNFDLKVVADVNDREYYSVLCDSYGKILSKVMSIEMNEGNYGEIAGKVSQIMRDSQDLLEENQPTVQIN